MSEKIGKHHCPIFLKENLINQLNIKLTESVIDETVLNWSSIIIENLIIHLFFEKDLLKIVELALPFIEKINENKRPLILIFKVVQMLRQVAISLYSKEIEVSTEENKAFATKLIPVSLVKKYFEIKIHIMNYRKKVIFESLFSISKIQLKTKMFHYLLILQLPLCHDY